MKCRKIIIQDFIPIVVLPANMKLQYKHSNIIMTIIIRCQYTIMKILILMWEMQRSKRHLRLFQSLTP